MTPPAGIFTGAASCVTLAAHIIDLLTTAKSNKDEFKSLLAALQSICAFLEQLPRDGITSQGNSVLCECRTAQQLLHSFVFVPLKV